MHKDCKEEKKRTIQDYQNKNFQLFFLISGILIAKSIWGMYISNSPLSRNVKIYEIYLTVLIGIHVRCQSSVCIVVSKCLSSIFCSLCLLRRPTVPVGTLQNPCVYDKEGATREKGEGSNESQRYIDDQIKSL